jgi:amphiphysin
MKTVPSAVSSPNNFGKSSLPVHQLSSEIKGLNAVNSGGSSSRISLPPGYESSTNRFSQLPQYEPPSEYSKAIPISTSKEQVKISKPPPIPPSKPKKTVIALYDFDAQENGDLSFREGDIITILKMSESSDDWWTGYFNGKTGQVNSQII